MTQNVFKNGSGLYSKSQRDRLIKSTENFILNGLLPNLGCTPAETSVTYKDITNTMRVSFKLNSFSPFIASKLKEGLDTFFLYRGLKAFAYRPEIVGLFTLLDFDVILSQCGVEEAGLSQVLYHLTDLYKCAENLKQNRMRMSSTMGNTSDFSLTKGKIYFMSLARSPASDYLLGFISGSVILKINGAKLGSRYTGIPVDYWSSLQRRKAGSSEMEDRIVSDKPYIEDASDYIEAIFISISPASNILSTKAYSLLTIVKYCRRYDIPVYINPGSAKLSGNSWIANPNIYVKNGKIKDITWLIDKLKTIRIRTNGTQGMLNSIYTTVTSVLSLYSILKNSQDTSDESTLSIFKRAGVDTVSKSTDGFSYKDPIYRWWFELTNYPKSESLNKLMSLISDIKSNPAYNDLSDKFARTLLKYGFNNILSFYNSLQTLAGVREKIDRKL